LHGDVISWSVEDEGQVYGCDCDVVWWVDEGDVGAVGVIDYEPVGEQDEREMRISRNSRGRCEREEERKPTKQSAKRFHLTPTVPPHCPNTVSHHSLPPLLIHLSRHWGQGQIQ
jgi:hypothetical protein